MASPTEAEFFKKLRKYMRNSMQVFYELLSINIGIYRETKGGNAGIGFPKIADSVHGTAKNQRTE